MRAKTFYGTCEKRIPESNWSRHQRAVNFAALVEATLLCRKKSTHPNLSKFLTAALLKKFFSQHLEL